MQAAASKADVIMSPASVVLSAAQGLADAGISAAGLVTYADKSGRSAKLSLTHIASQQTAIYCMPCQ